MMLVYSILIISNYQKVIVLCLIFEKRLEIKILQKKKKKNETLVNPYNDVKISKDN